MADLAKYEGFLRERLLPDLQRLLNDRDILLSDIQDIMHTRSQVQLLEGQSSMKTMMNVGCDFYMQASIPDTSKLLIKVDPKTELSVQMSSLEALAFLDKREAMQQRCVVLIVLHSAIHGIMDMQTSQSSIRQDCRG